MTGKQPKYHSPPIIRQRAKELRWPQTPVEDALWARLHNKQLYGLKFRRQHPLHHFILDFYCHAHQLVVEVDGGIHLQQQDYDAARTAWLTQRGFKVIRFTNDEVLTSMDAVLQKIAQLCGVISPNPPKGGVTPDPLTRGESIPLKESEHILPSGGPGGPL